MAANFHDMTAKRQANRLEMEGDKEVRRIARLLSAQTGNDALADAIVARTAEARAATAKNEALPSWAESAATFAVAPRIPPIQLSAMLAARESACVPPPLNTHFFATLRQMMHAFGDAQGGDPANAVALEADVTRYVERIVPLMRVVCKVKHLRMNHFASIMPDTTRAYFRWRVLRAMAAERKAADEAKVASDAGGAAAPNDDDDDVEVMDDGEGEEYEGGGAGAAAAASADAEALSDGDSVCADDDLVGRAPEGGDDADAAAAAATTTSSACDDAADADCSAPPPPEDNLIPDVFAVAVADDAVPFLPGDGGGSVAGAVAATASMNEEEQDAAICALLQTQAEEELRAAPGGQVEAAAPSETWKAFMDRLAFANRRSRAMSALQYAIFSRAREVGFTSNSSSYVTKHFVSLLPPPLLTKTALEVIGYLAYDRVGTIVEQACAQAAGKAPGEMVAARSPVPLAVYADVLARQGDLPPELVSRAEVVNAQAQRTVQLSKLAGLRAQLMADLHRGGDAAAAASGAAGAGAPIASGITAAVASGAIRPPPPASTATAAAAASIDDAAFANFFSAAVVKPLVAAAAPAPVIAAPPPGPLMPRQLDPAASSDGAAAAAAPGIAPSASAAAAAHSDAVFAVAVNVLFGRPPATAAAAAAAPASRGRRSSANRYLS